jgi:MFS family permease
VGRVLPTIFFGFGGFLALAITLPVFLQVVLLQTPGDAGLLMILLTFSTTITAYWSGRYLRRSGDYRRPPLLGFPLAAASALLFAFAIDHAAPWSAALMMLGVGLGIGPIFPTAIVAAQNAVAPRDIGAVTGAVGYARSLGGAVGAAAATALVLALVPRAGELRGLDDLVRAQLGSAERAMVAGAFRWLFVAVALQILIGWAIYMRVAARPLRAHPAAARED